MKILMPLPKVDFDPSETSIPWKILTELGHEFVFATNDGEKGQADQRMLDGNKLGILKPLLIAAPVARSAHGQMIQSSEFLNPINFDEVDIAQFDAVLFPGGHAPGMREYLECEKVQKMAIDAFALDKVVGAVCHGTLVLARAINPETGKSILYGKKTTSLLAQQENLAVMLTKRKLGDYYRTYPGITVQEEVTAVLESTSDFKEGSLALFRDDMKHLSRGFVCVDGKYASCRWPGDVHSWSVKIDELLRNS